VFLGAGSGGVLAHAQNLVLAGPHPFLKENAVSLQYLIGNGLGDSWSGTGVGLGYGYKLSGPVWLDLQINFRGATCSFFTGHCPPYRGNAGEVMAGVAWRFRTDIPVVPYARAAAGMLYLFPEAGENVAGVGARAGFGAKYYVFDWFGFSLEGALSLGHGFFAADYRGTRAHAVGDVAMGVEAQF
jgi:hypothetical protein